MGKIRFRDLVRPVKQRAAGIELHGSFFHRYAFVPDLERVRAEVAKNGIAAAFDAIVLHNQRAAFRHVVQNARLICN